MLSIGGGEGSRTPVRKPLTDAFYECILCFRIPPTQRSQTSYALRYPENP